MIVEHKTGLKRFGWMAFRALMMCYFVVLLPLVVWALANMIFNEYNIKSFVFGFYAAYTLAATLLYPFMLLYYSGREYLPRVKAAVIFIVVFILNITFIYLIGGLEYPEYRRLTFLGIEIPMQSEAAFMLIFSLCSTIGFPLKNYLK